MINGLLVVNNDTLLIAEDKMIYVGNRGYFDELFIDIGLDFDDNAINEDFYEPLGWWNGQGYYGSGGGPTNVWIPISGDNNWSSVATSYTGQYITAVTNGGQIYTSYNYGATLIPVGTAQNWTGVAVSSTGQYQTAIANGSQINVSQDYGQTWNVYSIALAWVSIDMSLDGKYQVAVSTGGGIYVSSDFGLTGILVNITELWYKVIVSDSGQYVYAWTTDGKLYFSSDFGVSFTLQSTSFISGSIAMSSDGKYVYKTIKVDNLYLSSDYGVTFVPMNGINDWLATACSSSGIIATTITENAFYYIWGYANFNLPSFCSKVAMSPSGAIQMIVGVNGITYYSYDFGHTFVPAGSPLVFADINPTLSGNKFIAFVSGGKIYFWNNG